MEKYSNKRLRLIKQSLQMITNEELTNDLMCECSLYISDQANEITTSLKQFINIQQCGEFIGYHCGIYLQNRELLKNKYKPIKGVYSVIAKPFDNRCEKHNNNEQLKLF